MSQLFQKIQALAANGDVLVSLHGLEELEADNISVRDAVAGVAAAVVVEEYPAYSKGPACWFSNTISRAQFTFFGAFQPAMIHPLFW